jgi:CheY-like chemotaxis protein
MPGHLPVSATSLRHREKGAMARLLIVDDEPDTVRILSLALQVLGHEALGAVSGPAALEAIAACPSDGVLLDVMMPEMDGFETLRRIRTSPDSGDLPVVFVTASAETDLDVRAAAAGAQGVLRKPIDLHRLEEWIEEHAIQRAVPIVQPSLSV